MRKNLGPPHGPQDRPMFRCLSCDLNALESRRFTLIMGQRVRCPECLSESVTFCGWFRHDPAALTIPARPIPENIGLLGDHELIVEGVAV